VQRSFTAEIIGPAGAGKSTLTGLLGGRDVRIRTGLSIWGLPLPLLATGAFSSLTDLVALFGTRRFSLEDLKLVIQINTLQQLLRRESEKGYRLLLLDEGEVFGLARLRAYRTGSVASDSTAWMSSLLNRVAPTLDVVIWLDAPDAVLAQRIRERDKPHRTKNLREADICEHLGRYRAAFEQVMSELTRRSPLKVITFRTDRQPLEEIANQILAGARDESKLNVNS
jgi:broad-specificity NMP kinase